MGPDGCGRFDVPFANRRGQDLELNPPGHRFRAGSLVQIRADPVEYLSALPEQRRSVESEQYSPSMHILDWRHNRSCETVGPDDCLLQRWDRRNDSRMYHQPDSKTPMKGGGTPRLSAVQRDTRRVG